MNVSLCLICTNSSINKSFRVKDLLIIAINSNYSKLLSMLEENPKLLYDKISFFFSLMELPNLQSWNQKRLLVLNF